MKQRDGFPLFRQTLSVLVGALILSHLVGFLTLVLLPSGGHDAVTFSALVQQLASADCQQRAVGLRNDRNVKLSQSSEAPRIPDNLRSDPRLTTQMANALGRPENSLRLAWEPESAIHLGRVVTLSLAGREARVEEVIFFGQLLFAAQRGDAWCVGEVPPLRWYQYWKTRVALNMLLSLIVFLLLAWWFARRLSRPIHEFATAADAIGRDEQAPLLEEKGPREMRIAARALNAMQTRILGQAKERETMIASIAHDLRTPLSRIAFRVESAPDEVSESVQRDIEQMKVMISTTLEFTREGSLTMGKQRIDLGELLGAIVVEEKAIGKQVDFVAPAGEVVVSGSEVQLNRLFQNLLDNAHLYGDRAEVGLRVADSRAVVEIADHGPGLKESEFEEMLRPFSRGEPSRNRETGGIGLGLSIAQSIVKKHGGTITLANREQGGLVVTVALPLASAR